MRTMRAASLTVAAHGGSPRPTTLNDPRNALRRLSALQTRQRPLGGGCRMGTGVNVRRLPPQGHQASLAHAYPVRCQSAALKGSRRVNNGRCLQVGYHGSDRPREGG